MTDLNTREVEVLRTSLECTRRRAKELAEENMRLLAEVAELQELFVAADEVADVASVDPLLAARINGAVVRSRRAVEGRRREQVSPGPQ